MEPGLGMQSAAIDWFLVGNGGMGFLGLLYRTLRGYHRDPFPHSLLRTRETRTIRSPKYSRIVSLLHYAGFYVLLRRIRDKSPKP